MSPKWFVVLAMMGAVVALLFTSLSTYDAMIALATFKPGHQLHFAARHLPGLSGWLMIVMGVLAFALVNFERSSRLILPSGVAAVCFFLATGCFAYATSTMQAALTVFSTSETPQADVFMFEVMKTRTPLFVGWFSVVAAATLVCVASLNGRPMESRMGRWWSYWDLKSRTLFQHAVAISTSLLVVAAIIWSGLSMIRFEQAINPGNADLTELLRDLSGLIRADQIFTLVVFGCGCLCLVAIAASQTLPKTAAESTTDSNIDS